MSHTQPASDARKIAMPSHSTGWWYHAEPAWIVASRLVIVSRMRPVVDVGSQHVDLVGGQARAPWRHVALAPIVDGLVDVCHGAAVQPDVVGEVGRAQRRVALAFGAMAGSAGGE